MLVEPSGGLRERLERLHRAMVDAETRILARRTDLPPARRQSAANLLHYLALRQHDVRAAQAQLAACGLSSLGRAESHVLRSVEAVLRCVRRLDQCDDQDLSGLHEGDGDLDRNARALFGCPPPRRAVRIMVTMPAEAARDGRLIRELLVAGMDCMRVNAAHDDADAWSRMVAHLARAREETGKPCRVLMDLAGPRLRTGPVEPGPPVVRWRPQRDVFGRVVRPARVWLTGADGVRRAPAGAATVLPVDAAWVSDLEIGETLTLIDTRDKRRELVVVGRGDGGVWAESQQTAYVAPSTRLRRGGRRAMRDTEIGDLPATQQSIVLKPGDTLILTGDSVPGRPAVVDKQGRVLEPATIGVSLNQVFTDIRPGHAIWFDDGRMGGSIRTVESDRAEVTIVEAKAEGSILSAEKGINLPDTELRLPPLTTKDIDDLHFIAAHADIVGYSFVRSAADVDALQSHLAAVNGGELGLILKIETRRAFDHLPSLLLAAMRSPASGVMIARGDLAVECGFERLAEVQEEILWMAEASHMPVIWATQVLETLAKQGLPSRAEITDAAMGERAECVMLNKGPNIVRAVRVLDDILVRMQAHQRKKSAMLRHLDVADRFFDAQ